jgi:hypothetical protein
MSYEAVIADLTSKRDALTDVIDKLTQLSAPPPRAPLGARPPRTKTAARQTDGRTDGAKRGPHSRSLPDREVQKRIAPATTKGPGAGATPATAEIVQARDAAILGALKKGKKPFGTLRDAMPVEDGQDDSQRRQACSNALTRLRIKKQVRSTDDGEWELA